MVILDFLKWWYVDFLIGDNMSWTNLIYLFSKTALLLFGALTSIVIVHMIFEQIHAIFSNKKRAELKEERRLIKKYHETND